MIKICFIGAGSTIFSKNVLGDVMLTESLRDAEIALYDISEVRIEESLKTLSAINNKLNNSRATFKTYVGVENRKAALKGSTFVVSAIQVGGYDPCTITDFEIPKKYGLRQTIADTVGIGGIMRGLRTMNVFEGIANDMHEMCKDAWLLNYVNPMSIVTGYMQRYTNVKTIGLCHSVQTCVKHLFEGIGLEDKIDETSSLIAGVNHMAWLLELRDKNGNDIYPMVKKLALEKSEKEKHKDMVRYEYIKHLGYYCTESSEHNAEYNAFFIKSKYPQFIEDYNIPLDEYPRRCLNFIDDWNKKRNQILDENSQTHEKSLEYAARIMSAIVTNKPDKIGGNIINRGLIENLPDNACVEVPCLVDASGINGVKVGKLPLQLAAMNMGMINTQLLTIEAHVTKKKEHIYHAAMMDPHTAAELSIDDIKKMCDEMLSEHSAYLPQYN